MQETLACSYIPQSYQQERGLTLALQVWTNKRGGCPWPFRSGPTREGAAPGPSGLDQQERRLPLALQVWTRPELVHVGLGLERPLCPALPEAIYISRTSRSSRLAEQGV